MLRSASVTGAKQHKSLLHASVVFSAPLPGADWLKRSVPSWTYIPVEARPAERRPMSLGGSPRPGQAESRPAAVYQPALPLGPQEPGLSANACHNEI